MVVIQKKLTCNSPYLLRNSEQEIEFKWLQESLLLIDTENGCILFTMVFQNIHSINEPWNFWYSRCMAIPIFLKINKTDIFRESCLILLTHIL